MMTIVVLNTALSFIPFTKIAVIIAVIITAVRSKYDPVAKKCPVPVLKSIGAVESEKGMTMPKLLRRS